MGTIEPVCRHGLPAPEELIDRARWLREQNLSCGTIAEMTGLSKSTVAKYIQGQGEAFYEIECRQCGETAVRFRRHHAGFCSEKCRRQWRYIHDPEFRAQRARHRRTYEMRKKMRARMM